MTIQFRQMVKTLDNIFDTNCPPLLWLPFYLLPVWKGIFNWPGLYGKFGNG